MAATSTVVSFHPQAPEERARGITISTAHVEYETGTAESAQNENAYNFNP
jgi:translation elongation factor EF-Tu-like GTPase